MTTVYMDYAGTATGENKDDIIVFATVVEPSTLASAINNRKKSITQKLKEKGFVFGPKFEFHAYSIAHGEDDWGQLQDRRFRQDILKELRKIIIELNLPSIAIAIKKKEGGLRSSSDYNKLLRSLLSQSTSNDVNDFVFQKLRKTDPTFKLKGEPFRNLIGLLFGLTNGIINARNFDETVDTLVDTQFVKQINIWGSTFSLLGSYWESFINAGLFYTWPNKNQPNWFIGKNIQEIDSENSFGVQLADYVADITRRLWELPYEGYDGFGIFSGNQVVNISEGIYVSMTNDLTLQDQIMKAKKHKKGHIKGFHTRYI
ncbi:MAG: DUF3800 domain-containing protein [Chloroflexi bacterium]|nr:DUF3800 domain-containing protein [Chloroflexota bacterium]